MYNLLVELPPGTFSILDKINSCEDRRCIERVVDEYLSSLVKGREDLVPKFKLFEDERAVDEKAVANSYLFTEFLVSRLISAELDVDVVVKDLEEKLGRDHPVILFLKHIKDE